MCLKNKDLLKESHIIPKSLYKLLAGKNGLLVFLNSKRPELKYNSAYDKYILCADCDGGIIGKLDDYGAKFLHAKFPNKSTPQTRYVDGEKCLVFEDDPNYDYTKFKLFLLSILWRSSVSSHPFFRAVKLSPDTKEILRLMIKDGDAGKPDEYPCFIHLPPVTESSEGHHGFNIAHLPTMSPVCVETDGIKICKFIITGCHYYFIIDRPKNIRVIPSMEKDRLTIRFSTRMEQDMLIQQIFEIIRDQKDTQ